MEFRRPEASDQDVSGVCSFGGSEGESENLSHASQELPMVASNLWFSLAHKGIQTVSISIAIQLCVCVPSSLFKNLLFDVRI